MTLEMISAPRSPALVDLHNNVRACVRACVRTGRYTLAFVRLRTYIVRGSYFFLSFPLLFFGEGEFLGKANYWYLECMCMRACVIMAPRCDGAVGREALQPASTHATRRGFVVQRRDAYKPLGGL